MRKLLVFTLFIILFYAAGTHVTVPTGFATYNEWLEATGNSDTEANYKYFLTNVEQFDF